jgi:hypothetical protein
VAAVEAASVTVLLPVAVHVAPHHLLKVLWKALHVFLDASWCRNSAVRYLHNKKQSFMRFKIEVSANKLSHTENAQTKHDSHIKNIKYH